MTFEDFRGRVSVITGEEADRLRQRYIDRFVDTTSKQYRNNIARRQQFSDGVFYTGYLWDSLKNVEVIPESETRADHLLDRTGYVFWDLHSADRIRIKDYWKFPKEAVLAGRYKDLLDGQAYLPEDLYTFDDSLSCSIIFTHEYDDAKHRFYYRTR